MVVPSYKKPSRRTALLAALALLTLPSVALADTEERQERRHGGGEVRGAGNPDRDSGARGNWSQPRQPSAQLEQVSRPAPVQRGWRGANSGGWSPPASAAVQSATPPTARSNSGWGNRSSDDNGSRPRGDRGSRWSGGNTTTDATPAPSWRRPDRGTDDRRVETRGDGRLTSTEDRRDRSGRRDDRSGDGWRSSDDRNLAYRDGRRHDSWRDDRNHDRDRSGYGSNHHRWNNNWRRDNRYNWHSYRNHHRDIFRHDTYYSPYRNYRYSRLSIGFFLDSLFYSNRYWINDPWQYRLPDAYGPYRWVRYYDDALLVDIYSGEVVDVINNFFW